MPSKKTFKSSFKIMAGYGEKDWVLEAEFDLTEEELHQAVAALEEHDYFFNLDLPTAMSDAIWSTAHDQAIEDASEMAEYEDMTEDEIEDDISWDCFEIWDISKPELKE